MVTATVTATVMGEGATVVVFRDPDINTTAVSAAVGRRCRVPEAGGAFCLRLRNWSASTTIWRSSSKK
jgi:hypothetical protein